MPKGANPQTAATLRVPGGAGGEFGIAFCMVQPEKTKGVVFVSPTAGGPMTSTGQLSQRWQGTGGRIKN